MPTYTVVLMVEVEAPSPEAAADTFFGYVTDYPLEATERVQVVEGAAEAITLTPDGPDDTTPPLTASAASWTRSPAGELHLPR